jgi:5-(carboxyamino)imidazole ribonucleotide synthase
LATIKPELFWKIAYRKIDAGTADVNEIQKSKSDSKLPLPSTPLPKGSMIGLVGGGQLGMFFTQAAQRLGYRVCCFCNRDDEPAARFADEVVCGSFDDDSAIEKISSLCDVVTYEFESIPPATLEAISSRCQLKPALNVVQTAQNRSFEKNFLREHGIPTSDFQIVDSFETFKSGMALLASDCVLKTSTEGYDGKGQWLVSADASDESLAEIYQETEGRHCTLEKLIDLDFELSMIVAGDQHDNFVTIGPVTNQHVNHILDLSWVEEGVDPVVVDRVNELARLVAEKFGLVGTFCVEFFVSKTGEVLVNEIAPRPHNSGHLTIDSYSLSQFDLQALAVSGHAIEVPVQQKPAVMLNLLGDLWNAGRPNFEAAIAEVSQSTGSEVRLHLYGKAEPRRGRKMGHVTILNPDLKVAIDASQQFRAAVTPSGSGANNLS